MSVRHVCVVGAGVVGVACAYYLRRAGVEVTLLDRGTVGGACSRGNCGYICPSHVLPLAGPGVIAKTLPLLFQRESPLAIRWRLDPALWMWLWKFAKRCNRHDMIESAVGIQSLLNSSRELYQELFRDGPLEAEWENQGLLFVFWTARELDHYAQTDRLLTEQFAMPARRYASKELTDLEPTLKPEVAGAYHYEMDSHLRPDRLMTSWQSLLVSRGVNIQENCEFLGFVTEGHKLRGLKTKNGEIGVDAVVMATGAWTPQLAKHMAAAVPIQPGKGYSITMARPKICPRIPMIFEEDRVAVTPMKSGFRIGSTMEFAGYDSSMNRARLELLRKAARRYLLEPEAEPVQEEWWGWRPMTPDGKPIIGPSPRVPNVYIAAGHGMLGLSMAPATGKLIAELVTETTPHISATPYTATRF